MDKEKVKELAALLNIPEDQVQSLVTSTAAKEAKIQAAGVAFKAEEPTTTTTEKAAMVAADPNDASDVVTENAIGDPADEGMEPDGDENMLTPAECEHIAQMVVDKLMPHLNIGSKMDEVKSMLGGMGASYAKKDAEQAELKEAQTTQQAEIASLKARLAQLEGDQPKGGGYRASLDTNTVVKGAAPAQPAADPLNDFVSGFILGANPGQPSA